MKIYYFILFILSIFLLFNITSYAGTFNSLGEKSTAQTKNDSLPAGFTEDVMKDLRDEDGNRIIPDDEGDAFLQRSFNGFASGDIYGWSVSSAGDVNGDGYDDIIIGAPQNGFAGTYAGRAYIYYGGINVNSVADVILTGEAANNFFGYSVAAAGDVNSDGYSDVLVGAYGYNTYTGRSYIYYGGAVMNNSPDVIMTGENANDQFGYSVSEAGDVNGDGYRDLLIGANGNNSSTGSAYIFYGGTSMDNIYDLIFYGEFPDDNYGASVSTAGDVNGDGYSDVLMGAPDYDSNTGKVYIYFGGSSMDNINDLSMTGENIDNYFGTSAASAGDLNMDGYSDLIIGAPGAEGYAGRAYAYYGGSSMDDLADVILNGENSNDEFGTSVSSAGDVNGDGFDDIIAGAPGYDSFRGRAYIFFGGVLLNNTSDLTITGEATVTYFGYSVSNAGDVNGDGYSDVITGAYGYNSIAGKAYLNMYGMNGTFLSTLNMSGSGTLVQFGQSVSSAGDVNGDGFPDIIVGAPSFGPPVGNAYIFFGGINMDNIADVTFTGEASDNRLGQSVSAAGDVNGDGYADVIAGAYGYGTFRGRAYVYYGGAAMNNVADVIMTGEAVNNDFGISVSGAGDVNGDGYADVIVGAGRYNTETGRAYVYLGGAVMNNTADVIMTGETTNNNFGQSVASAGDLNADGYDDMIIGAQRYNSYTGRAYIYYGGASVNNSADLILNGTAANDYFGNSVSSAGDINNDGFSDVIVASYGYNVFTGRAGIYFGGTSMSSSPGVILSGETSLSYFGASTASAGDINGDGFSDIIISAIGGTAVMGKAYIFYGGAVMNNASDVIFTGEVINTSFGNSVASAGDLNGDGSNDLLIGNIGLNSYAGRCFVYFTSSPNVHPGILTVTDVPDDQGSYANIKWTRSSYDVTVSGLVTNYLIERSIPPGISGYNWVSLGTIPAVQNTQYNYEARTSSDNSIFFFRVTALTNNVTVKWRSNILSGSSIDNLAPLAPLNLAAAQAGSSVSLSWNQNPESDLRQYIIYRNGIQTGTSAVINFTDNSISPDSAYTYTIAAEDIHGNISGLSKTASVTIITTDISLKIIPQGFYNSGKKLNMKDTVKAYLHSVVSPYNVTDSAVSVIDSVSFTGTFKFLNTLTGYYFIVIKHRNSIETWSKAGGESIVSGTSSDYDFTDALSKAFGSNLTQADASPVRFAVFSGDINQDGFIDLTDVILAYNDASSFTTGYKSSDVSGDNITDLTDMLLAYNNSNKFVNSVKP